MTATAWSGRSVPAAMSVEQLAAWVNTAVSGADGMLFTATPREELDEIGRFQQLKDQAWAGLVRAIVASHNRAPSGVREFVPDEVALALGVSVDTAKGVIAQALAAAALPGLVEAVAAGMLTERHVWVVLRELDLVGALTLEQRQCVVLVMLARYAGQTPGELGKLVRRLILTVDRVAALARQEQATRERRVAFYPDRDGQGVMLARGPVEAIAAMKAALAASLAAAGKTLGDERLVEQREFDLLVELLTGTTEPAGWHAHLVMPPPSDDGRGGNGGDSDGSSAGPSGAGPTGPGPGCADGAGLAEIPGFGPVLPSTAWALLGRAVQVSSINLNPDGSVRSVNDPIRFVPLAAPDPVLAAVEQLRRHPAPASDCTYGLEGYRVPKRVQRLVEARDRTCVFPGCPRLAWQTDKDHRVPWPLGPTHPDNLQCLCRRHHRAKQTAFTVELTDDLNYQWTSRGGWQFLRQRQGYP